MGIYFISPQLLYHPRVKPASSEEFLIARSSTLVTTVETLREQSQYKHMSLLDAVTKTKRYAACLSINIIGLTTSSGRMRSATLPNSDESALPTYLDSINSDYLTCL
jgi:hypothetical protein